MQTYDMLLRKDKPKEAADFMTEQKRKIETQKGDHEFYENSGLFKRTIKYK